MLSTGQAMPTRSKARVVGVNPSVSLSKGHSTLGEMEDIGVAVANCIDSSNLSPNYRKAHPSCSRDSGEFHCVTRRPARQPEKGVGGTRRVVWATVLTQYHVIVARHMIDRWSRR